MKFVLIFGGIAAGKMTVGQELAKITGLRLFHNHITIEPVIEVFGYFDIGVTIRLREIIFEEFVRTDHYGMVFTGCWALENPGDWEYFGKVAEYFTNAGGEAYYVNLVASREARLARNETENRIKHKPSMRHTELSRKRLIESDERHRWESIDGEFDSKKFLKIDNTVLQPEIAAKMIKDYFSL